jgi:DUF218 domain-containing protein
MMLRKLILSLVLLTSSFAQNTGFSSSTFHGRINASTDVAFAQPAARKPSGFDSAYRLSLPNPVQDKNFYLLSLFQRNKQARKLISRNRVLRELAKDKLLSLKKASSCDNASCFDQLMRFDDPTIEAVASELQRLANAPQFKRVAKTDLHPSGVFIKYNQQSDGQMFVAAWKDAAAGLNRILSVYGLGKDPRYKEIDRVSFDVSSEAYSNLVKAKIGAIRFSPAPLFFEPTMKFALGLLEINRRDEAGRYEPLESGENKAAVRNLRKIKWSDYPYSFILVLGSGPSDSARLSPIGAQRTDVGAQLFLQKKAPLIIVSGGHVHPMHTPYCEAIEMKKYLIEKYKIPEARILVEPYARHTTTNFRDAARLAFRYRIPTTLALVTSSEEHITSVTAEQFRTRNLNELGYFPVEFIRRVSAVEAEFQPSIVSLFFDANDPLDP